MSADALYREMMEKHGWPDPETVDRNLRPIDEAIERGASDDEIADLLVELAERGGAVEEEGES